MKSIKKFAFGIIAVAALGLTSCDPDPCYGVTCPEGYACEDGTCVEVNPTIDNEVVSGLISADVTWKADRIYELAGKVVVSNGATLTIEPGAIIKGRTGTGTLASALIIARGAKINACGTADKPIIFTSVLDNIKLGEKAGTNLTELDREKWGGLLILGNAPTSTGDGDKVGQIEGIPADEPYGIYGGDNATDNSGTLCYVSIRHGGALIGEGNEINGLTLGGVGSGTTIHHIEVVSNLDDGIECFGGTVNIDHVIVAYQGDDALDIDQNYSGTITNFYIIHGGDTDEGMEIDGPEGSTYTTGKFKFIKGTVRSNDGKGSAADLKSKAQGTIENVAFVGYTTFAKVSASFNTDCTDKKDAYLNAIGGDLVVKGCEFVAATDMYRVYSSSACLPTDYQANLVNAWAANGNTKPAAATKGADVTAFKSWSWTDIKGLIK
ncbi:MAG TPA: hypothetical protein DCQ58_10185 [Saprospirales bacterium]|nr:hypothetical protein [Saprospirales bacterium]